MKKVQKLTHVGIIEGCDARTPDGYTERVLLRETKGSWITKYGTKYNKRREGRGHGAYPMYYLDLNSVIPIDSD